MSAQAGIRRWHRTSLQGLPSNFSTVVAHNSTEIRSQKLVAARHDVYVLSLDFNQLRSPMFVCNVRAPAQRVELFGNIFALPNSSGTRTVCIKILGKNSMVY